MNLSEITIRNFRGIREQKLNFTDSLERINDVTLIVGPNGAGKSSILDAIWFGLQAAVGYPMLRRHFRREPAYLVHAGRQYAEVEYWFRVSEEERQRIQRWKSELIEQKAIGYSLETKLTEGHITWKHPPQPDTNQDGYIYHSNYDWDLLRGAAYARQIKRLNIQNYHDLFLAGGVYLFEQERFIVDESVKDLPRQRDGSQDQDDSALEGTRLLYRLTDLGARSLFGQLPEKDNWYEKIQEGFNKICAPKKMGNVFSSSADGEYDVAFEDGGGTAYRFHGLSSGERSVLNFLVQYFSMRMFNAVILIDELELHLHPIWQRRLLRHLQDLARENNNQLIITTHSPTLVSSVRSEQIIELGAIDDHTQALAWQPIQEET